MNTWAFALPTIRGYFSGVGDLFSAMVLAHYDNPESQSDLPTFPHAVSKALLTVQQILLRTHLYALSQADSSGGATSTPLLHSGSSAKADVDSVIPSDAELDDHPLVKPKDPKVKAKRMRIRELRVVQERNLIAEGGDGWPARELDWSAILAAETSTRATRQDADG